ncbi:Nucleoside-diphosphate-sugar epimerase [Candidatus Electrothrix laxa]
MSHSVQQQFRGAKVLITGATGFTGVVLARKLAAAGARIHIIARPGSDIGPLKNLDIIWFRGDVYTPSVIKKATYGIEYIFHLAASFREVQRTDEGYRKVHLTSTKLLASAAKKLPSFKRFIHISTVGVHGHIPSGESADEEYRFSPGDGYQRTKLEGEQWLADFASQNDFPCTIIRPAAIFGPGDGRLLKFFRMINSGFLPMLGKGNGMYHLIHVNDLTEIFLLAAISQKTRSEVFIAANNEPISIIDIGKIIAQALNKKMRVVRLPLRPFLLAADICQLICAQFNIQPPLYRRRVAFYINNRRFNNKKMKDLLGYHLQYNNEKGLTETALWYAEQGWLGKKRPFIPKRQAKGSNKHKEQYQPYISSSYRKHS